MKYAIGLLIVMFGCMGLAVGGSIFACLVIIAIGAKIIGSQFK